LQEEIEKIETEIR